MKRSTKLLSMLVASALFAGALVGCGGGDKKKAAGDVIKIGGNLEMTGGSASYGIASKMGMELAIDQINAKGGIGGKKLALVVADNKSEAAEGTNAMTKLVSQDKVVAVVGPNLSSSVIAASAVNNSAKVLDITPMGTNENVTVDKATKKVRPYNFRACFIDPFQGLIMSKYVKEELKLNKTAIYIDNSSDYAKGLAASFVENYKKLGGTIVTTEAYLQKDTDFKATLTKIKATNPDFIYIPGYYQEVGLIIKQAREIGLNVAIGGGDGWDSAKLPEIAGKAALNNTFFSNVYSSSDPSEINKKFVSEFQAKYKQAPDVFAALSYDCTLLIAKAIEDAKGADPVKMAEAMAKIKGFQGVSGTVTFDQFHNPTKSAFILEHKDGKQVFKAKVNP